jgi:hypothetical protein
MLLKTRANEHLIEVVNLIDLMNLNVAEVIGCAQEGEEQQDPQAFNKADLVFLSGEDLPRCWTDPHYRDNEIR